MSLEIAERLTKTDPGNAVGQRDLAADIGRGIGDIHKAQGNLPEALRFYRASLDMAARLTKTDPGNATRQHDLAATYTGLADILNALGDLPEALKCYQASLAIAERLTDMDPRDAGRQRDLAIAHSEVGNVRKLLGDLAGALQSYQAGVTIMGRAAKANPGNAGWQRDLSAMYNRVGDALKAQAGWERRSSPIRRASPSWTAWRASVRHRADRPTRADETTTLRAGHRCTRLAPNCRGIRQCAPRSIGAMACLRTLNRRCCAFSRSFRAISRCGPPARWLQMKIALVQRRTTILPVQLP
jgi:hypothetical protein